VFFRLSKYEKPPSFLSLDSLNKHRKTYTEPNHSFLGFIKHTLKDEITSTSICYPPQACVKIKRYSPEMVGENLGKKCVSIFLLVVVIVSLEHDTPFVIQSGLGNPFVSCLTFCKFISWVVSKSMLPIPLSCHSYVQESSNPTQAFYRFNHLQLSIPTMLAFSVSVSNHIHTLIYLKCVTYFVSLMGDTSRPSCDESVLVDFKSLSGNKN
jgi:hypothetical protein